MSPPELGVGVVYSSKLAPILVSEPSIVDVVEVEPQTIWFESTSGSDRYRIDENAIGQLKSFECAKIIHGIGFPVGGTLRPDSEQFPPMNQVLSDLNAVWTSEHLSFNKVTGPNGEFRTGFMLPSRQTRAGVKAAVESIKFTVDRIPAPFAVETGVNYLKPRQDELSDGEFVREVVEAANCGILLDLHNIWTNENNGRQSTEEFLGEIPLDRVWEVHLAGGLRYRNYWLDAHSGAVPKPVLELARRIIPRLPNLNALIFEVYPSFIPEVGLDVVRSQLEILHDLWNLRSRQQPNRNCRPFCGSRAGGVEAANDAPSPADWERTLGALVTGQATSGDLAGELIADPGVAVYRELVGEFRSSMVVNALKLTSRLLLLTVGQEGLRDLLAGHWKCSTPELFASTEAVNFSKYLEYQDIDIPYLTEVLDFEKAVLAALIDGERSFIEFSCNPLSLLNALAQRHLPASLPEGNFEVEVTPDTAAPFAEINRVGLQSEMGLVKS